MGITVAATSAGIAYKEPTVGMRVADRKCEPKLIQRADLEKFVPDQATFLSILASGIAHGTPAGNTASLLFIRAAYLINQAAKREREFQNDGKPSKFAMSDRNRQFCIAEKDTLGISYIVISSVKEETVVENNSLISEASREAANELLGVYSVVITVGDPDIKGNIYSCKVDLLDEVNLQQNLTKTYPVI